MAPHVAILIPSRGQRALANLARDAIAAFTEDVSHEVWSLDHDGAQGWPMGSKANGQSLNQLLAMLFNSQEVTHVFAMHDDALPLRARWLSYLLSQLGPVIGVKASERNGYAHSSGVLWTRDFAVRHSMLPDLPTRDAGEWPADWTACALPWRPVTTAWQRPASADEDWWRRFSCDVSFDDRRRPFYIHFGGGSLKNRPDRDAWIAAARQALGL